MLQVLLQSLKWAIHFKIMSILSRAQFKVYAFKQRVWINHGPKTDPFASLLEEFEAYSTRLRYEASLAFQTTYYMKHI